MWLSIRAVKHESLLHSLCVCSSGREVQELQSQDAIKGAVNTVFE